MKMMIIYQPQRKQRKKHLKQKKKPEQKFYQQESEEQASTVGKYFKLNQLGLDKLLCIAVEEGTQINQKATYTLVAHIGRLGYDSYVIRNSYIYYDAYIMMHIRFFHLILIDQSV